MTVNATSLLGGAANTNTKKKDDNSPEAIQERFMSLLVAQLKNQDPLAPMDNAQITSQMAQLNTVTGIQNLNSTMQGMAAALQSNQTLQSTAMLGRAVLTEGNDVRLVEGVASGSVDLAQTVDTLKVNIMNSRGELIRSLDMGSQPKGVHEFSWDGLDAEGNPMSDGLYKFEIEAKAAGQNAAFTPLSLAVVVGLRNMDGGIPKLLTSNGEEIAFADIKQVF